MKLNLRPLALILPLLIAFSSVSFAATDKKKTKLRIAAISADANGEVKDCKVSIKEIEGYDGGIKEDSYLCGNLTDEKKEISVSELASLVNQNLIEVSYEGDSEESLLSTLNAWKEALVKFNQSNPEFLDQVTPWDFQLIGRTENQVSLNLVNAKTSESLTLAVTMNKPAKD